MTAVLIPSARSKATGGNPFAPDVFDYRSRTTFNYFHDLIPDRRYVVRQLQQLVESGDRETIEQALGTSVSESALTLTRRLFKAPLMAARKRYAPGVFYTELDFNGLPTGAQRRFLENTVIVNPLFGLVRPDDMMPDYELNMAGALPEIGPISEYWKPRVSPLLNTVVREKFVWDLLPEVFAAVWENDETYRARARVQFYDELGEIIEDDIGHKGSLVSHLMHQNAKGIPALAGTEERFGFFMDEEESDLDGKELSVAMVRH